MLQIRTQIALSGVVQTWVRQSRTLIIGRPCQKASLARKGHDVYWETLSRGGVTRVQDTFTAVSHNLFHLKQQTW